MTALIPALAGGLDRRRDPRHRRRPAPGSRATASSPRRRASASRTRRGAPGSCFLPVSRWASSAGSSPAGSWRSSIAPIAVIGLPILLVAPPAATQIARLEAMEEWTRSLSGVLTVGIGLEQALVATLRSTPAPIAAEVQRLVARLRARWDTEKALRAFADELDDATGDLIAANLILGARRRGAGLASVLEGLAESVAADVRARRQVEADRAKPRATARWVTADQRERARRTRAVRDVRRAVPQPRSAR